ncbi:MAG: NADH-quinone oxidoreductase subunit A [Deltaproteobacteria bacterium]|jgi:NADH-quinone oxidoreductase subunit A|nr:NADH-quinone oxidoreductase subunit A [Deltaproteobacteria bacterium]
MGYQFAAVLAFAVMAVLFALVVLMVGRLLRPRFPNDDKLSIYECGERPVGSAWYNFNPRFYLIALVFIVFEVDIALTFPVVVVYAAWIEKGLGFVAFVELILFTVVLLVGLAWAWGHGDLEWIKKLSESPRKTDRSGLVAPTARPGV